MSDEIILSHPNGAMTKITVEERNDGLQQAGEVVVEIETDGNFDDTKIQVWIDNHLYFNEER